MHRICRLLCGLLACVFLFSGCSIYPTKSSTPQSVSSVRNYQNIIHIAGRLSIRYLQNDKEKSAIVRFDWQQNLEQTEIVFYSPLGNQLARLVLQKDLARWEEENKSPLLAQTPEELLMQILGWPLPENSMNDLALWMQGFTREKNQIKMIENDLLTSHGWQVRYHRWQSTGDGGLIYPYLMTAERASPNFIVLKMIIDQWQIPTP